MLLTAAMVPARPVRADSAQTIRQRAPRGRRKRSRHRVIWLAIAQSVWTLGPTPAGHSQPSGPTFTPHTRLTAPASGAARKRARRELVWGS